MAEDYTIEKVADGMVFCEGPVWIPDGYLLFSDVHGSTIQKWSEEGGLETWLDIGKKTNGLILSADNKTIYACCYSERELLAIDVETKEVKVLADNWKGRAFNNVNDVAIDTEGNVYFTDPKWGAKEGDVQGVYCYHTSGSLSLAIEVDEQPNGLVISPDQQWLYVGRSGAHDIWRYKLLGEGKFDEGQQWIELEDDAEPDGMTVDSEGLLYVAQAQNDKIALIAPHGKIRRLIQMDRNFPTNCEFKGDSEEKVLFVTFGGLKDARLGELKKITFLGPKYY